jgi:peptidoglycan/xylan/chitin deacetylase (PgdA/CDA1 family)
MMVNAKKFFTLAALLLLQLSFSMAYNCPDTCVGPSCRCATHEIPGGLSPEETPQFIVFTNDDAVTVMTQPAILNITERHVNRNGCRMPATWFISQQYTDPALVQQVYAKGHEIATHTMTHVQNPSVDEIVGCKLWLHNTAKIPMEDIKGYRSPFLAFSPAQRKVLFENGFGYDSSITETYPSETSPDSGNLLWPYSMDYGIGQNCAISTGTCDANEKYPGMWEFPMWNVQDATGMSVASMDPVGDLYTLYKTMFDQRYNGNRAPLGIFFHAARLIGWPEGMDELNRFIEYAMTKENVWLVTASQAMDWVKNPVPASEYSVECSVQNEMLGQNGGQLCVMPSSGCQYGLWNSAACVCECQNEKINAAGYCKDAEGSCSLQKDYDFTATTYVCNSPPQPPTTAPSTTPTPTAPTTPTTTTPTVPPTAAVVVSSKEEGCNGHPILSYTGMSMSGTGDPSALYAAATKVIDSKCDTCSEAMPAGSHSFFTVSLSASQDITSVKVFSPSNMYVDLFIGDSLTNNGMENAQCASSAHIVPNVDNTIPCVGKGKVVTIRAPGPMTLCDVYPVSAVTEVVAPVSGSTTAAGTVKAVIDVMGKLKLSLFVFICLIFIWKGRERERDGPPFVVLLCCITLHFWLCLPAIASYLFLSYLPQW